MLSLQEEKEDHWKFSNVVSKMRQQNICARDVWFILISWFALVCLIEAREMEVCARVLDESTDAVCAAVMSVEDAQQATCITGSLVQDGQSTAVQTSLAIIDQPR